MWEQQFTDKTPGIGMFDGATSEGVADPGAGMIRGGRIGRYVVLHAVGSGGASNVFAAYDPLLDRKIALKVLSAQALGSAGSAAGRAWLEREARAAARLVHPNVVRLYDVGQAGERIYLAMELLEGPTLRDWLDERPRSWRQVVRVFLEAGRGLAAAHAANLVHRDFKPSNVMLGRDGRVVLLDFGLARLAAEVLPHEASGRGDAEAASGTAGAAGTPPYMAPEQARGEAVDSRADQYAFCMALSRALDASSRGARGCPRRLRRFLRRGLSTDRDRRFASFDDLLARLEAAARPLRWSVISSFVLVTALGSIGWWASGGRAVCGGADQHLAGVWDDRLRATSRAAFLAADLPFGRDSWRLASGRLDAFALEWVDGHREACEATSVHGEQSERLLDLRMRCLHGHLEGLRSIGELFSTADEQVVRNAPRIAGALGDLDECADPRRLALSPILPPEELADEVRDVRALLSRARVQEAAGRLDRSLELARQADARAEETRFQPLLAESKFRLGTLQGRSGDRPAQTASLLTSVRHAEAAGHEEYVARGLTELIVAAVMRGNADEAAAWGTISDGAIERFGADRGLRARRLLFLAMLSHLRGDGFGAIAGYGEWLAAVPDPGPVERGAAETNVGMVYLAQGRLEEAERHLASGRRLLEEGYGRLHPEVAVALVPLADLELRRGRPRRALDLFSQAEGLTLGGTGADARSSTAALAGQGRAHLELGRRPAAIDALERSIARAEELGGNPAEVASWRFDLARALWAEGAERVRAVELARHALADLGKAPPPWPAQRRRVEAWLADRGPA